MICKTTSCLSHAGISGFCNRCAQLALMAKQTEAMLTDEPLPGLPDIQPIRPPQCLACPTRAHLSADGLCPTCASEFARLNGVHTMSIYEWLLWKSA